MFQRTKDAERGLITRMSWPTYLRLIWPFSAESDRISFAERAKIHEVIDAVNSAFAVNFRDFHEFCEMNATFRRRHMRFRMDCLLIASAIFRLIAPQSPDPYLR